MLIAAASFVLVVSVAGATACAGNKSGDADDADSTAAATAATPSNAPAATAATAASSQPTDAPLEVADIDRWQRGMEGELEAVHKAGDAMHNAKNMSDSTTALFAANESSTLAAGAKAAGVSEARYQTIRTTLGPLAAEFAPIEAEMDVSKMPAAMVDQLKKSREASAEKSAASLPPALVDALKPRAAELRKQSLALVAERMKAAGMAK
jgi:hypothetical protein